MNTNNIENYNSCNHAPQMTVGAACQKIANLLERVKQEVFSEYQAVLGANEPLLRLALVEADALARQTEYPHLLFPLLAAEKARKAARWQFHQQFLLRSNDALAA